MNNNELTIRRYFTEVFDNKKIQIIDDVFAKDCIFHQTEISEPLVGTDDYKQIINAWISTEDEVIKTKFEKVLIVDDHVICHLQQNISLVSNKNKSFSSNLTAMFRFNQGKIIESWEWGLPLTEQYQ